MWLMQQNFIDHDREHQRNRNTYNDSKQRDNLPIDESSFFMQGKFENRFYVNMLLHKKRL